MVTCATRKLFFEIYGPIKIHHIEVMAGHYFLVPGSFHPTVVPKKDTESLENHTFTGSPVPPRSDHQQVTLCTPSPALLAMF